MQVSYNSDLRTFQVVKIFFPRTGVHKIATKKKQTQIKDFFSILDVEYFFNKRTIT